MASPSVTDLVKTFQLVPHPEGGFYKETYRSGGMIRALPSPFKGDRSYCTAIHFMLTRGTKSNLHRIASDEMWHFYLGGPMTVVELHPDGRCEQVVLGQDIARGQKLQHVVPAGCWFGGFPNEGTQYSFVGCTVAPGFDFADFELAGRHDLVARYPEHEKLIVRLTENET